MEWITQNAGNILVGALVLGAFVWAAIALLLGRSKSRKCGGCPYSGYCGKTK